MKYLLGVVGLLIMVFLIYGLGEATYVAMCNGNTFGMLLGILTILFNTIVFIMILIMVIS